MAFGAYVVCTVSPHRSCSRCINWSHMRRWFYPVPRSAYCIQQPILVSMTPLCLKKDIDVISLGGLEKDTILTQQPWLLDYPVCVTASFAVYDVTLDISWREQAVAQGLFMYLLILSCLNAGKNHEKITGDPGCFFPCCVFYLLGTIGCTCCELISPPYLHHRQQSIAKTLLSKYKYSAYVLEMFLLK